MRLRKARNSAESTKMRCVVDPVETRWDRCLDGRYFWSWAEIETITIEIKVLNFSRKENHVELIAILPYFYIDCSPDRDHGYVVTSMPVLWTTVDNWVILLTLGNSRTVNRTEGRSKTKLLNSSYHWQIIAPAESDEVDSCLVVMLRRTSSFLFL